MQERLRRIKRAAGQAAYLAAYGKQLIHDRFIHVNDRLKALGRQAERDAEGWVSRAGDGWGVIQSPKPPGTTCRWDLDWILDSRFGFSDFSAASTGRSFARDCTDITAPAALTGCQRGAKAGTGNGNETTKTSIWCRLVILDLIPAKPNDLNSPADHFRMWGISVVKPADYRRDTSVNIYRQRPVGGLSFEANRSVTRTVW